MSLAKKENGQHHQQGNGILLSARLVIIDDPFQRITSSSFVSASKKGILSSYKYQYVNNCHVMCDDGEGDDDDDDGSVRFGLHYVRCVSHTSSYIRNVCMFLQVHFIHGQT